MGKGHSLFLKKTYLTPTILSVPFHPPLKDAGYLKCMPVQIPYSVVKLRLFLRSYHVVEILLILSSYSSPQPYEMVVILM